MTVALPPWADPPADEAGELGALLTFAMSDGAAALAQCTIRFEAGPGEQRVGRPAALCNTPRPGEPLVATLPPLAPGEGLDLVLEVDTVLPSGGGTLIPVKITHNL